MSGANNVPDAQAIRSLRLQLVSAEQQLNDGLTAVKRALKTLEVWEDGNVGSNAPYGAPDQTVAIMRERGGRGLPSKIDRYPALRSFVLMHIQTLPYAEIVQLVSERFPKEQHTSISSLNRWWIKNRPQKARNG